MVPYLIRLEDHMAVVKMVARAHLRVAFAVDKAEVG
jgi:hypothetical protein